MATVSAHHPARHLVDGPPAGPSTGRAHALRLAASGDLDSALAALDQLWSSETKAAESLVDFAWAHLLAGDPERALRALTLAVRSASRASGTTREAIVACVLVQPSLVRRALRLVPAAGSVSDGIALGSAVLRARRAA